MYIYLSGTTIESPAVERSGERSCINIQSNTNTGYMYVCTVPGVQCRVTFYNATSNQYFVSFRLLASKSSFRFWGEQRQYNTTRWHNYTITQQWKLQLMNHLSISRRYKRTWRRNDALMWVSVYYPVHVVPVSTTPHLHVVHRCKFVVHVMYMSLYHQYMATCELLHVYMYMYVWSSISKSSMIWKRCWFSYIGKFKLFLDSFVNSLVIKYFQIIHDMKTLLIFVYWQV